MQWTTEDKEIPIECGFAQLLLDRQPIDHPRNVMETQVMNHFHMAVY
jgi:hypothetical protein